jgi:hypothetical protein
METVGEPAEPARFLRFACPACGRKYATKPELAGQKIRCNRCGAGVRVPQGDATPVAQPTRPSILTEWGIDDEADPPRPTRRDRPKRADVRSGADDAEGDSSLLDELASIQGVKRPDRPGSVLSSRTELVGKVLDEAAEPEAVETQKMVAKAKKKKKKKKKSSGYFDPKDTLALVGGVAVVVAVLALLAWRYPDLRFPLGGLLCVVGFIVYLLGAAALRQLVAEQGAFKLLLFRFFPPYQLWFVATNWGETKDFVAFFASGLIIMAIGGAVIKTSPIGKKAEESERAYQTTRQGRQAEVPPALSKGRADNGE